MRKKADLQFICDGDVVRIALTQGQWAIVDAADHDLVVGRKWFARRRSDGKGYYACTGSPRFRLYLHHMLLPPEAGKRLDHIDGDGLNNRRGNLRLATAQQNNWNRKLAVNSRSGLKGASWQAGRKKWQAGIMRDGRQIYLGRFDTKEDAHAAYCRAASELFGEFARAA